MLCLSLSTHSSLRLSPLLHISTLHTHFLSLPTSSLHPLPLSTRFLSPPTWSDSALPPRCAHAFIHMILACSGCVLPTPEPTHKKQKCAYLWVTSIVATASRALNPLSKPSLMCTYTHMVLTQQVPGGCMLQLVLCLRLHVVRFIGTEGVISNQTGHRPTQHQPPHHKPILVHKIQYIHIRKCNACRCLGQPLQYTS